MSLRFGGEAIRASAIRLLIVAGLGVAGSLAAPTGCVRGMRAIDDHTMRLLEERSDDLGPSADPPKQSWEPARSYDREDQYEYRPPTANPAPAQLEFDQADADRDVAARLERYTVEALGSEDPDRVRIDFETALELAQVSGREFVTAEEEYILDAIRYLIERHRWSPRLFNDSSVELTGTGDEGRFETAVNIMNELRVTQRLPYGGDVEARWVWEATQQLRDQVTDEYVQSSQLILSADIPLLRDAGRIAREDIIQASRDLVYAARTFERFRREFLTQIADDYFSLLETKARIASQLRQIESQSEFLRMTRAKVEAGVEASFQARLVQTDLDAAISNLASLQEQFILQFERFKIRLGLDPRTPAELLPLDLSLPEPEIDPGLAAERALRYRLDLQNRRDQINDARRGVANARNQILPDLDFSGNVTLPTNDDESVGGLSFKPGDTDFNASVTFGLPLDREIERLNLRQSVITLERQVRDFNEFRDNVIVDARRAVRNVDLARFTLELAQQRVRENELRLEEQKIKADEIDPQERIDTENELLDAQNDRDRALTDLRNAVLDYLLQTGQLRVANEGTLMPLPGMRDGSGPDGEPEAPDDAPEAMPKPNGDEPAPDGAGARG